MQVRFYINRFDIYAHIEPSGCYLVHLLENYLDARPTWIDLATDVRFPWAKAMDMIAAMSVDERARVDTSTYDWHVAMREQKLGQPLFRLSGRDVDRLFQRCSMIGAAP